MARKTARPGRTLVIFFLLIAVSYGLVAIAGTWKPALGLDLKGGTRITLIAEGNPSSENLQEAADIIDQRVNGSGVTEAEVSTQGNRFIIVEIPGDTSNSLIDTVKRQAQLRFRTVACTSSNPGPCATSAPTPGDPTASDTAQPGVGVTVPPSPTAEPSESPSAKNRPGFALADDKKKPKKRTNAAAQTTESPSASPSDSPSASPSASPSESPSGSPADGDGKASPAAEALAFISNPPQEAIDAYNAYTCPSETPPVDDPTTWLVTCGAQDDAATKYLLSPAAIEGTDLKSADAGIPQGEVQWVVNLSLGGDGKDVFTDLSTSMAGSEQRFAIVLDGLVISAPTFEGRISDGNARISGNFTSSSAKSLATSLKFGALPISFEKDGTSVDQIGASLAGDQLSAGITAGIIGLLLVMLYCLLYYRGLGLVVIASLIVAAAITYSVVLLLGETAGFTLTLPGIAGLIVAVGITADSFIVYFERIRDEMRDGKSMRVAVEAGWRRARNTCLAADAVSLLAAVVLYIFAAGVVKGFAFALGISTLIDLAVFFWFTHPSVALLGRYRFFNRGHKLSGLSAETLGVDRINTVGGTA
ncbi:protein translocase subunit SecD [Nocardioides sp. MAH-18]|uniref:Protein translocase subunit SecD n=1 Tax=Nocardioides agri TaxID=2682843 RepID=A0A6L6XL25_9ACTN|nr:MULTISPECIES: protein translocase subunit SecD [unclassified Nocardioides]MBA2953059.1 protein translocase subunit SecD [Nocardioides sp. CGMCC 1.13656]MVQ47929.1 protein translocase subunit SecD [Nocardioides sp. MAH-18]